MEVNCLSPEYFVLRTQASIWVSPHNPSLALVRSVPHRDGACYDEVALAREVSGHLAMLRAEAATPI